MTIWVDTFYIKHKKVEKYVLSITSNAKLTLDQNVTLQNMKTCVL